MPFQNKGKKRAAKESDLNLILKVRYDTSNLRNARRLERSDWVIDYRVIIIVLSKHTQANNA